MMNNEKTFKIPMNPANVSTGIIPTDSTMTADLLTEVAHFVALQAMKTDLSEVKAYRTLIKMFDDNEGIDHDTLIAQATENPVKYGFSALKDVAKAVDTMTRIDDIDSDLNQLTEAGNTWRTNLTNEGDALVVYVYAYTMYNKLTIPAFNGDSNGLKKLAGLVIDHFSEADLTNTEKLVEVRKSMQAFWSYAYTKKTVVFNAVKIREKDIPAEIVRNFCARVSKGAKVDKDTGDFLYSYNKNKKRLAQALTEAFAYCLISRLDSFEISSPGSQAEAPVSTPGNNPSTKPEKPATKKRTKSGKNTTETA